MFLTLFFLLVNMQLNVPIHSLLLRHGQMNESTTYTSTTDNTRVRENHVQYTNIPITEFAN